MSLPWFTQWRCPSSHISSRQQTILETEYRSKKRQKTIQRYTVSIGWTSFSSPHKEVCESVFTVNLMSSNQLWTGLHWARPVGMSGGRPWWLGDVGSPSQLQAAPIPSKEMLDNERGKDTSFLARMGMILQAVWVSASHQDGLWPVTVSQRNPFLPLLLCHGVCQSTRNEPRKTQAIRDVWKMVRYTSTGISFWSLWHKFVLR